MSLTDGTDERGRRFQASPAARRISRRRLLTQLGLGSLALAAGGVAASAGAYLLPQLNFEPSPVFSVGRPEDYQIGSMTLFEAQALFIFRDQIGFQAVSDICTHLGCAYKPYGAPDGQFNAVHAHCPCHGSVFRRDGVMLAGPAPRPVPFFQLSLTPDGRIEVDKSVFRPSDELSRASGEGIGHDLYLDPDSGRLVTGPLPSGEDLNLG